MTTLSHRLALLSAASTLVLAACGGGAHSNGTAPPAGGAALAQFSAVGSSSRSVNLSWAAPSVDGSYAVERKVAGGSYTQVALVNGRSGQFLDDGLVKGTAYSYRLRATDGSSATVAEGAATTTDEDGIVTAAGTALGAATQATLGVDGGQWLSADGRMALTLPAGAAATAIRAELQPVTNTAPDGQGDGLKVKLSALPTQPLVLTLAVEAGLADRIDGLRIAVQRSDGAWFSLPLTALDKTTRTLQAALPVQLLLAPGAATGTPAPLAAADVSVAFTIVKYLAFKLSPVSARVPVKGSLPLVPTARVRGYATEIGTCVRFDATTEACIFQPMLETRQLNLRNTKDGYQRQWLVNLSAGGSPGEGSVAPQGDVGAIYTAPPAVPDPDTVRVSFTSTSVASGRTLVLSAPVTIVDPRWHGDIKTINGPSDAGTTHTAIARATWNPDPAASTTTRKVYRAEGTVEVFVTDDDCTVTVAPGTAPISTDTRLVELVVDESTQPASYSLKLITFWPATLAAVCPKANDSQTTQTAGHGWQLSGEVGPDGKTIEGFEFGPEGERIDWHFSR